MGEPIEIDVPGGILGVRFYELSFNDSHFEELVHIYEAYKKNKEK